MWKTFQSIRTAAIYTGAIDRLIGKRVFLTWKNLRERLSLKTVHPAHAVHRHRSNENMLIVFQHSNPLGTQNTLLDTFSPHSTFQSILL